MEIGNFEKCQEKHQGKGFMTEKMSEQRQKDLQNNACFTCHKSGCRPWKHQNVEKKGTTKKLAWKNAQIAAESDSENE